MSGRRFLVTGGCGFIGSHLAEALAARGDAVRVLDDLSTGQLANLPPSAEFMRGSVTDAALVQRAMEGIDGVFHLAAIASVVRCTQDWVGSHAVNLTGTVTVLDAARRAGSGATPVVYASSAAIYGDTAAESLSEQTTPAPKSAYGVDKLGCEHHAAVATACFGVPTLGLRFFNVYGPRQDGSSPYSGVISAFCDRLGHGMPITIWGDGSQRRDFVYVGDVVAALLAGMARLPALPLVVPTLPLVINVCTGRTVSVRELARIVGGLYRVRPAIDYRTARADDIALSCGDPTLLNTSLGVTASTELRDGLSRVVAAPSLAA
jgi:UDP-glucose 4-epimerase